MCFSLAWFEQLLVWLVVVCMVVGILRLLLPYILSKLGDAGGVVMGVINIIIWGVIAIFVIYLCFALISCLAAGGGFPLFPHGR